MGSQYFKRLTVETAVPLGPVSLLPLSILHSESQGQPGSKWRGMRPHLLIGNLENIVAILETYRSEPVCPVPGTRAGMEARLK